MKRGLGLFPTADVGTMRELTRQAEELGYANAWFGDSPNIWREGYVTMAACAVGTERIVIGTGVIPRGMLRNILFLSGVGGLAPELAIAAATGNTARAHSLPSGRIEVGAPADLVLCDKIFGAAGTNALESMAKGDLPGISIVIADGRLQVEPRSQQTPPPMRPAVVVKKETP